MFQKYYGLSMFANTNALADLTSCGSVWFWVICLSIRWPNQWRVQMSWEPWPLKWRWTMVSWRFRDVWLLTRPNQKRWAGHSETESLTHEAARHKHVVLCPFFSYLRYENRKLEIWCSEWPPCLYRLVSRLRPECRSSATAASFWSKRLELCRSPRLTASPSGSSLIVRVQSQRRYC